MFKGATDYLLGRNNANNMDLNRDFPDLDKLVFDGAIDNNHLLKVLFLIFSILNAISAFQIQQAKLNHRIQPETESVIKMIMDNPFVVGYHFLMMIILLNHRIFILLENTLSDVILKS